MTDTFFSYSRRNKTEVKKIAEGLESKGFENWVDWESIAPTAEWRQEIAQGIESADNFIFFISETSLASRECGEELAVAVTNKKRIVPVVLNKPENYSDIPKPLGDIHWIFFDESDYDWNTALDMLADALTTDLDYVKTHTRLQQRSLEWQRGGENNSALLGGAELREAEVWLGIGKQPEPTDVQRRYIVASRIATTKRQRTILAGLSVTTLVLIALTVFALFQRQAAITEGNERATAEVVAVNNGATAISSGATAVSAESTAEFRLDESQSIAWASLAESLSDTNPLLSVALALEANREDTQSRDSQLSVLAERVLSDVAYRPGASRIVTLSSSEFQQVAYSPDSKFVLVVFDDGRIVRWDGESETTLLEIEEIGTTLGIDAVSDRAAVAACQLEVDCSIIIFDPATGDTLSSFTVSGSPIESLAFSNSGNRLAGGNGQGMVFIWNLDTGQELASWQSLPNFLADIAYSPDDDTIATAGCAGIDFVRCTQGEIVLHDSETGEVIERLNDHSGAVWDIEFTPDGSKIVSGGQDARMIVRDLNTDDLLIIDEFESIVRHIRVSSSAVFVQGADVYGNIVSWNIAIDKLDRRYRSAEVSTAGLGVLEDGSVLSSVQCLSLGESGSSLTGCKIVYWAIEHGALESIHLEQSGSLNDIALNTDQSMAALASADGTVGIFDMDAREYVAVYPKHSGLVTSVDFSRDGRTITTAACTEFGTASDNEQYCADSEILLWDVETGRTIRRLDEPFIFVTELRRHPDDRHIVATGCTSINAFALCDSIEVIQIDVETGELETIYSEQVSGTSVRAMALSPDGKWVVVAFIGRPVPFVVSMQTGEVLIELHGHGDDVTSVAISHDGSHIITGSLDQNVILWNAATGEIVRRFEGHSNEVWAVDFLGDSHIASADLSNQTLVWDIERGDAVRRFSRQPDESLLSIATTHDGRHILVGNNIGVLYEWRFDSPNELIDWTYRNRYVYELTCADRDQYDIDPFCEDGVSPVLTPFVPLTAQPSIEPPATATFAGPAPTVTPTVVVPTDTSVPAAMPLEAGMTAGGTLESGEAERWQFEGEAGQVINIAMIANNSALDTILTLYGPDGDLLAENDDFEDGDTNSFIGFFTLPVDGTYIIEAKGFATTSGNYLLLFEFEE